MIGMKMVPALFPLALIAAQVGAVGAAVSPEGCALRVQESGNLVTLQGVVDPRDWPQGNYEMILEARQGSNRSLSRQAGAFDAAGASTSKGLLVLSTTTTHVSIGGRLAVTLHVADGHRNVSCSFEYER
ncbi:MAG: curli-like amyloid fiber formation chaperone CsgH [Sulfitobacter sp.]